MRGSTSSSSQRRSPKRVQPNIHTADKPIQKLGSASKTLNARLPMGLSSPADLLQGPAALRRAAGPAHGAGGIDAGIARRLSRRTLRLTAFLGDDEGEKRGGEKHGRPRPLDGFVDRGHGATSPGG